MTKKTTAVLLGASLLMSVEPPWAQDRARGPGGPLGRGPGGRFGPPGERGSSLSKPPTAKNEAEKKILAV
jgi:hypothetical protein